MFSSIASSHSVLLKWSKKQFSSTYSYCFVLVLMSLRLSLMWKQNLYLFLIFCVCMFVLVWTWKCEHTPEKVNGEETGWARDCEKVSTDLWERIVSSSEIGENLSSSILHTLICQHIPTLKSTSSPTAEHISLLLAFAPCLSSNCMETCAWDAIPKIIPCSWGDIAKIVDDTRLKKTQLTGNLDMMKRSDMIPNAT